MDLNNLKSLVKRGEGEQLEFKLKTNHPEKIVREIAAFANTKGGKLLVGVSDEKQIVGLKFPDEDEFILIKNIEKLIEGELGYKVERVKVENEREVLIFDIEESVIKPAYYLNPEDPNEKKVYVRNADKSLQASKEVKEVLKGKSKNKGYKFNFGEKENLLVKYLSTNKYITIQTFSEIASIPTKIASRTLVLLVLGGVLNLIPQEYEDRFELLDTN